MKDSGAAAASVLAAGLAVSGADGVANAADDASLTVVHGSPDRSVDVVANRELTLRSFAPGTVAGPLSLPAESYRVSVFAAANTAGTGTP